jgi:hypothetical protein
MNIQIKNISNPIWANSNKTIIRCTLTIEDNSEERILTDYFIEKNIGPEWLQPAFDLMNTNSQLINDYDPDICTMESIIIPEDLNIKYRVQRNNLLLELDTIVNNPLRWASFTQEQQEALAAYRQELLDVPQQETFPDNIVWPTKPDFI